MWDIASQRNVIGEKYEKLTSLLTFRDMNAKEYCWNNYSYHGYILEHDEARNMTMVYIWH